MKLGKERIFARLGRGGCNRCAQLDKTGKRRNESGGHMWSLIQRSIRCAARPIMLGLVMGSLMIGGARSLAAMTATESVQNLLDQMVHVLEDKELKKPEHAGERRQKLEKLFEERFSYEEMAKRSLGAQWPKLDETQQHEFVGLFQKLLTNTYANR